MAHWLFKTEPDAFSIEDLQKRAPNPEPWDGIRNYQARNLLRDEVAVGDRVFIYHSSCKEVGIAGIAEVVNAAYADPAQFNPESRYYDPKSTADKPRWFCVDVQFVEKFPRVIRLAELKANPALNNMVLLKQGRLSVQPVTAGEAKAIMAMAS